MKWMCVALSLFLLSGALSGCRDTTKSAENPAGYNPSESETGQDAASAFTVGASGKTLTLCTPASDSGLYTVSAIWPNSCSILYIDFETCQQFCLCDSPNCLHNDDSCTSFISLEHGNHEPTVLSFNNKILLVQNAQAGETQGGIWIADGNGKNRERIFTTSDGQSLGAGIFSDGSDQYLYFLLSEVATSGEAEETETLVQLDLATGEIQRLFDCTDFMLYTTDRDCFVLCREQEGTKEYYYLYPGYGGPARIQEHPFYAHDVTNLGSYTKAGHIYTYNYETKLFSDLDLANGETRQVDCSPYAKQEDDVHKPDILGPYGDYFAYVTYQKNEEGFYESQYRYLNIQTGDWTEPVTLQDSLGHQIVPQQVLGDRFCVIAGYETMPVPVSDAENVEDADIGLPQYALIRQQDFMNSVPNYQMIHMEMLF